MLHIDIFPAAVNTEKHRTVSASTLAHSVLEVTEAQVCALVVTSCSATDTHIRSHDEYIHCINMLIRPLNALNICLCVRANNAFVAVTQRQNTTNSKNS